jgi:hypothetical protein
LELQEQETIVDWSTVAMACASCSSEKQAEFGAEMNIHFPDLDGLNKAGVWAFPKLTVCFDCGLTLLLLPENELRLREKGVAAQRP